MDEKLKEKEEAGRDTVERKFLPNGEYAMRTYMILYNVSVSAQRRTCVLFET